MKAPPFQYCRPESMEEAFELLARFGDDARLLAGGQSLLPAMHMRLSAPAVLVDLGRLPGLSGIEEEGGRLRVRAMTRHAEVEHSPLVARMAPLLSQAMPWVAHAPIRARGTFGGSIALADPAAEAPAATLAHEAQLVAASREGMRRIAAEDFFLGIYETALAPGEILLGAEFPPPAPGQRFALRELARRSGDFATAGVAVRADVTGDMVHAARIVVFGVADRPLVAHAAQQALAGARLDARAIARAEEALAQDVTPFADLHHDEATKLRLLRVVLRRTLDALSHGGGVVDA